MANASASSRNNLHFFQPLLPGFHSHLNIPIAFFSKQIKGTIKKGNAVVKLRSEASDLSWEVKMDGRRLTQGWEKFATSHDLRVGDIVILRHVGDLLFHVTAFGPNCCEIRYHEEDGHDDVIQISSDSDSDKYQDTREVVSLSDNSCFVARVTAWNLRNDMLFLPLGFSRSNGLMNRKSEIVLLNEDGKPVTVFLIYHKTQGRVTRVYIRSGWRRFCCENLKRANDLLTFKLVQTGKKPVLQLCSSMYNRDCLRASSSSTCQERFLTLTLTTYNLRNFKLCLPEKFVWLNGIENARKIILVDIYGIKRTTSLQPDNNNGKMRLGKEWREFCEVHGVKVGESFKLELIQEGDTSTPLLKFRSKVLKSL